MITQRYRRSADLSRAKRSPGEGGAAEPEPEGEPEPEPEDDYYCVKKSMGGKSLKSCLPKVKSLDENWEATTFQAELLLFVQYPVNT